MVKPYIGTTLNFFCPALLTKIVLIAKNKSYKLNCHSVPFQALIKEEI